MVPPDYARSPPTRLGQRPPQARPPELMSDSTLVLVSNRGPVTFGPDGEITRGTGGLVTALIGLASHREVTWVASAMSDEDVAQAERNGGRPFPVNAPDGGEFKVKLVASD